MNDYSINFLNPDLDWSGQGCDFEICCLFELSRINAVTIAEFIARAANKFQMTLIRAPDVQDTGSWKEIDVKKIDDVDNSISELMESIPNSFYIRFVDEKIESLYFHIWFYAPNEFLFGSESSYYYSGCNLEDRRRVANIVDLAFLGQSVFGDAIAHFAADPYCVEVAREKAASQCPPNLTAEFDRDWWIERVLFACEDTRLAEEEQTGEGIVRQTKHKPSAHYRATVKMPRNSKRRS